MTSKNASALDNLSLNDRGSTVYNLDKQPDKAFG